MSCSVATDGAREWRSHARSLDTAFKAKIAVEALQCRGCDGSGTGEAGTGSVHPEPDLCLEEAGSRQCGEPVRARGERFGRWRGGARARDGQALRQDRPTDGRTGFPWPGGQGDERARSKSDGRTAWARTCRCAANARACGRGALGGLPLPKPVAEADDLAVHAPHRRTASRTSVLRLAANDLRTQTRKALGSTASGCGG